MFADLPRPINTKLLNISHLLDNTNSSLFIKLENEQLTHSHKFRLAYGMFMNNPLPFNSFNGFVEASSGNTGLALAEITDWVNKPLHLFTSLSISEYYMKKLRKYNNVFIHKCNDMDDAYNEVLLFKNKNPEFIHLDQYNNSDAIVEFRNMAHEIANEQEDINAIVMGVGTGATLTGLANVFTDSKIIAATVEDDAFTVPGLKNFKVSKIYDTVLRLQDSVNFWNLVTIDEMIDNKQSLSEQLGFPINLSTSCNLLTAIKYGNSYNLNIATICTGNGKGEIY